MGELHPENQLPNKPWAGAVRSLHQHGHMHFFPS